MALVLGLAGVAAYLLAGVGDKPRPRETSSVPRSASTPDRTTSVPTLPRRSPAKSIISVANRSRFQNLERALGGTSGVAVSNVGLGQPITQLGTLRGGVAWSTIKVPIAAAVAVRSDGQLSSSTQELLFRAIAASDNSAAEDLWSSLGPPETAAAAVEEILAAAGDAVTQVETRVLRPGFTSFGQTEWPIAAQQRFIARLPCLREARPVLRLMQQVVPEQRWGLGALSFETRFKGGWGPDPSGGYLVRQIGIIKLSADRSIAATIATQPEDGTFESGAANLTRIAQWLVAYVDASAIAPARCTD